MNLRKIQKNNIELAIIDFDAVLITDDSSAVDFFATIQYESNCDRFVMRQSQFHPNFFDLKTGLAGRVLQKLVNYRMKLAIVGDFSIYPSKSLNDFIYEMNSGSDVCFINSEDGAIDRLSMI
ncbi:DUF4180 domain-containing protein [Leptospira sp. 96542]|nr:DUF4180 domain-containing protein [Leptospira sp. 96542]